MKKYLLLSLTLLPLLLSAQSRIVLKKGWKRVILTEGQDLGMTRANEPFYYSGWKQVCRGCSDTSCSNMIWTLHDIRQNEMVLTRFPLHDSAYIFDTLTESQFYKISQSQLWRYVDDIGDLDSGNYRIIGRRALFLDTMYVSYKSLASLSFARTQKCRGFTAALPLGALFMVIGAPFIASEKEGFNWSLFAIVEGAGLALSATIVSYVRRHKVNTYNLNDWSLTVK